MSTRLGAVGMALYYRGGHCRQLVGQRQGVVLQGKEGINEAYQIPEWKQCVWLCGQREPLYAFCGLEARSSASVKNFSKIRTMAKMVTEHRKVGCSDTK